MSLRQVKSRLYFSALAAAAAVTATGQTNHYVSLSGGNAPPYTNWLDAATTIQAAIDVSGTNDIIWVTNGIYQTGGVTNWPPGTALTNRVAIYRRVVVRSVNGPSNTVIAGRWHVPGDTNNVFGPAAVRCVYMAAGAELHGFTITNGATLAGVGGGGIYSETQAIISNCIITCNSASSWGGGIYGGATVYNCTVSYNVARSNGGGGAAYPSAVYNCAIFNNTVGVPPDHWGYGGGIYGGRAHNCLIVSNIARTGGGARNASLYNCRLFSNTATAEGGGGDYCWMYNCLVEGNFAGSGGGLWNQGSYSTNYNCTIVGNRGGWSGIGGVGAYAGKCVLLNCIVRDNAGANFNADATLSYCNSSPLPPGTGNIDADPQFVAPGSGYGPGRVFGDLRLTRRSPCMDKGMNFPWQQTDPLGYGRDKDLDGGPRIRRGTVDMGAYEIWVPRGSFFNAE